MTNEDTLNRCYRCSNKATHGNFCKRCAEHVAEMEKDWAWRKKRSDKRFKILSRPRYREAFITELIRELSKEHSYEYTLKNAYENTMGLVKKRMPKSEKSK